MDSKQKHRSDVERNRRYLSKAHSLMFYELDSSHDRRSPGGDFLMADNRYSRAPRRRIEKEFSRVNSVVVVGNTHLVLSTTEDAKTLVRMRLRLTWGTDGPDSMGMTIHVCPQGQIITGNNPGFAQALDNDETEQLLYRHSSNGIMAAGFTHEIEVDSKAMRKLKPGDEIHLSHVGTGVPGNSNLVGVVTLWFKE